MLAIEGQVQVGPLSVSGFDVTGNDVAFLGSLDHIGVVGEYSNSDEPRKDASPSSHSPSCQYCLSVGRPPTPRSQPGRPSRFRGHSHDRIDGIGSVGELAARLHPLQVIDNDDIGPLATNRRVKCCRCERRTNELDTIGDIPQPRHPIFDPFLMFGSQFRLMTLPKSTPDILASSRSRINFGSISTLRMSSRSLGSNRQASNPH